MDHMLLCDCLLPSALHCDTKGLEDKKERKRKKRMTCFETHFETHLVFQRIVRVLKETGITAL